MRILDIRHAPGDYCCMWNGVQDIYCTLSGERAPAHLFFAISGIGGFVYMRFKQPGGVRALVSWGDGRPKKMYPLVDKLIGFEWKCSDGGTFERAMKKAKAEIDVGRPVVLGCVDMKYLPYYPKLYMGESIPIHYVLMVGYDDERVYIYDCGRPDMQTLTYDNLRLALDIVKNDVGDKNGVFTFKFDDKLKTVREIAVPGFRAQARRILEPPVGFTGIKGMRKLAAEILKWESEFTEEEYIKTLRYFAEFTGEVPDSPARMNGLPDNGVKHTSSRPNLAKTLRELDYPEWRGAAEAFDASGEILQEMTDIVIDRVLGIGDRMAEIPRMINAIADGEESAWRILAK